MTADTLTPLDELKNLIVFAEEIHSSFVEVDFEATATFQDKSAITKALRLPRVIKELERRLSPEQIENLRLGYSQGLAGQISLDQHRSIFYSISLLPRNNMRDLVPGKRQCVELDVKLETMAPLYL